MKQVLLLILSTSFIFSGCNKTEQATPSLTAPTNLYAGSFIGAIPDPVPDYSYNNISHRNGQFINVIIASLYWNVQNLSAVGYKIERKTENGNYSVVCIVSANSNSNCGSGVFPY